MINLSLLIPKVPKKARKRKGQGRATGNGTFAGRGLNGQNSRSGGGVRPLFEGGQSGLLARMPKRRGFRNHNRVVAQIVSIADIEANYDTDGLVNLESLFAKGLVSGQNAKVKILGGSECTKKLTIGAELLISASAKEAIEKAGGSIEA